MIFQYPEIIKKIQCEPYFRYAVLHGLCFRDGHNSPEVHAYSVGFWCGLITERYVAKYHCSPLENKVNITKMLVDEVNRLDKESKNG